MTSPPPIVPGPGDPAPPPQVVYVQASSATQGGQQAAAVTKGVLSALGWVLVVVLAVCVMIPALLCLISLIGSQASKAGT